MSSLIISQRWLPNVIISPLSPSSFFIGLLMLISRILRQIRLTINIVNLITWIISLISLIGVVISLGSPTIRLISPMIRIGLILLMSIIISQIMLIIQVSLILSLLSVCADAVAELKLRGYNSLPGWGRAWIMILHAWPARSCYMD